jgi:hypothetical protein
MKAPPVDLRALTEALRADPAGARELAAVLMTALATAAAERTEYSSRRGCGPTGYPERKWREVARQIGTRAPGCRWYTVSARALATYEAVAAAERQVAPTTPATSNMWSPESAIRGAGLRVVGGRK